MLSDLSPDVHSAGALILLNLEWLSVRISRILSKYFAHFSP